MPIDKARIICLCKITISIHCILIRSFTFYSLHVQVFELLREQLWYRPNAGIYIKLIVMLGKCKQPERAHSLFEAMKDEGCLINHESYTALVSAYSRSGLFDQAFSLLDEMKVTYGCYPDVQTYSILIKSCLHFFDFDKVQILLSDMEKEGIHPNTVTYNTLIDAFGKAGRYTVLIMIYRQLLYKYSTYFGQSSQLCAHIVVTKQCFFWKILCKTQ